MEYEGLDMGSELVRPHPTEEHEEYRVPLEERDGSSRDVVREAELHLEKKAALRAALRLPRLFPAP